jgi:mitotic spindle assembly checkpoint protein MAD1
MTHSCRATSTTSTSEINALASLRLVHASLLEEHGEAVARQSEHQASIASLSEKNDALNEEIASLKSVITALKDDVARKQKKWEVGRRESDFLRAILVRIYVQIFDIGPT